MHPAFQKALNDLHDIADADKDGKITKQDAAIVIAQLQARATAATQRATPLGAILIAAVAGIAIGVLGCKWWPF